MVEVAEHRSNFLFFSSLFIGVKANDDVNLMCGHRHCLPNRMQPTIGESTMGIQSHQCTDIHHMKASQKQVTNPSHAVLIYRLRSVVLRLNGLLLHLT